jgi:hypothetical protein
MESSKIPSKQAVHEHELRMRKKKKIGSTSYHKFFISDYI